MSSPASTAGSNLTVTRLVASRGRFHLDLQGLWAFRDLARILAWRDLKVRYKQTFLGAAWAVLQPLLTMAAFSLFFGKLAKVPSDGHPYPVFVFSGTIVWQLFSNALTQSSSSLVANQALLTKVYFPRLIIPISSVLSGLVDFAISLVFLFLVMAHYGVVPGRQLVFLPVFVVLAVLVALALGIWLAALNVRYRDVRYAIPFLIQIWMLATPIAYPAALVPERWRSFYALNPMVGIVEALRWSLFGDRPFPAAMLGVSSLTCLVILYTGIWYFRRTERTFADIV
jgi:homopolymeric O-antigen transport system permease protein